MEVSKLSSASNSSPSAATLNKRDRHQLAERAPFSVLSSPRLVDILFLPHSTVHELTSNRIVLGNVLLLDIFFVNPSALTSLSVKSRSDSQLYILS
jgi:hypothetical protein